MLGLLASGCFVLFFEVVVSADLSVDCFNSDFSIFFSFTASLLFIVDADGEDDDCASCVVTAVSCAFDFSTGPLSAEASGFVGEVEGTLAGDTLLAAESAADVSVAFIGLLFFLGVCLVRGDVAPPTFVASFGGDVDILRFDDGVVVAAFTAVADAFVDSVFAVDEVFNIDKLTPAGTGTLAEATDVTAEPLFVRVTLKPAGV